jgi:hypothetical protein
MNDRNDRQVVDSPETVRGRFFVFLAAYLAINVMIFVIDLADGGGWWFFYPLLGMGIAVAIKAAKTFGPGAVSQGSRQAIGSSIGAAPRPSAAAPAPPAPSVDRRNLVDEAETRVARLWRVARQIESPSVRERAFAVCAAADRVAEALAEGNGDRETAQVFLDRYLGPAESILGRYVRLAGRGVAAAEPALATVESRDLPLLESKLNDLYEQLHRGDVIDLKVASEMLEFELDNPSPPPRRALDS